MGLTTYATTFDELLDFWRGQNRIPSGGDKATSRALSTWLVPLALFATGLLACRWALALWRDDGDAAPVLEPAK